MLTPAPLFHDHAVLQRDISIPIWGTALPHERVTVQLAGHLAQSKCNPDGTWFLRLPPLPAGGPHELHIATEKEDVTVRDVLIGDVWICSGQSNMQYLLSQVDETGEQSRGVDLPNIRLLTVNTPARADRQSELHGTWQLCDEETLANFSGVGGWFGRKLHEELDIPVGLIANAWGGTRIQAWLSREALMGDARCREEIEAYERELYQPLTEDALKFPSYDAWFQACGPEDRSQPGLNAGWAAPDFDDSSWPLMNLPARWQEEGHDFNGVFWFRKTVALPEAWRGQPLCLHLGAIDKHDETYVNGALVGGMGWNQPNSWCTPREYGLSPEQSQSPALHIAIRVRSHQFHGGLIGPAVRMRLHPLGGETEAIPLNGDWRYAIEQNWGNIVAPAGVMQGGNGPGQPNAPYTLFHSRLCPLIPYGIRGWLWYQGESNGEQGEAYRSLLPLMIEDWRRAWGQGDPPFLIVQLANHMPPGDTLRETRGWPLLRQAQLEALRLPRTGLAVTIDVGEERDIHPRDKKTVGLRLARWALAREYGHGGLAGGPRLRAARAAADGKMMLSFDDAAGLRTRDGDPVRWLAIAGPERKFLPAESRILGEELHVWHPDIPHPAAVCYAWVQNPEGCNLVNAEGLPAAPFDTDYLPK